MRKQKVALFAYDFPHRKTYDFITKLTDEKYHIEWVIGAPKIRLPASQVSYRFTDDSTGLVHPAELCKRLGIPYIVSYHNSLQTVVHIRENPVDLHIISGARILSPAVIKACKDRILNIHPGLLPEMRGIDTLLWSIYCDTPIGITGHLISDKVDRGRCVYREQLAIHSNDTIEALFRRLMSEQNRALLKALKLLEDENASLLSLDTVKSKYHSAMPSEFIPIVLRKFTSWRDRCVAKQRGFVGYQPQ